MSNRLSMERSPYLLQHAENPVNRRPWEPEVFEEAKHSDKPIFLSIGYSTCHWCHVMAHESFEDDTVAQLVMVVKTPESADALEALAPFTKDYPIPAQGARYYLCRGGACVQPVDSIPELETVLRSITGLEL